jgi:hypothetical protein
LPTNILVKLVRALEINTMLFNLIYISKATKLMTENELLYLLNQSTAWNKDHGLTGMLIYIEGRFIDRVEGRFMQVLEGTEYEVDRIFKNISKDARHHQLIVLKRGELESRNFDSWLMGFNSIGLDDYKQHPNFFELNDEYLKSENFKSSNSALSFLKSFYDTHKTFNFN